MEPVAAGIEVKDQTAGPLVEQTGQVTITVLVFHQADRLMTARGAIFST